jgi:hypothetical protein
MGFPSSAVVIGRRLLRLTRWFMQVRSNTNYAAGRPAAGGTPVNADLVKLVEIFLVPNTILVGALGVASTEPLKTGISILGLVVSILWGICSRDAFQAIHASPSTRELVLAWLPVLFLVCWLISAGAHGWRWKKGL